MKHTFNRTLAAAAVAFAIVLVAGCDTTGPAPGTSPVVGTWRLVSVTIRATGATLIVPGQFVFEADGDFVFELTYNGERRSESGTYVVDDSAARITMTTTMRNGQRVAGMALFDYVLDGDEADFIEPPESGSGRHLPCTASPMSTRRCEPLTAQERTNPAPSRPAARHGENLTK